MNQQAETFPCARCGTPISEAGAFWTADGQVCGGCEKREIVQESWLKAARSAGYGALASGIVCFFFNPFFAFTILAFTSGGWALKAYKTNDPAEREMAQKNPGPKTTAIIGMVFAGLYVGMQVLAMAGVSLLSL